MGRVVIELTNRCNLKCQHCFTGRHGGRDDLPMDILQKILLEAKDCGFDYLSFTGGDPTVLRNFSEVVRLTCEAGYRFGFNTNGWNFKTTYANLLPYREQLNTITFSLDGASEETHDRLRGKGSFRRVLQAASICVVEDLPFTFNMVVTAHNRHEIQLMADLATRLGSGGLRYGHLMPSPITTAQGFDLTPWERKMVEAEIWELRRNAPIRMAMAPGYFTTDIFPCAPLNMMEVNVDCFGNLTKCCHLSGHGDGVGQGDVIGNLSDITFAEAVDLLVKENSAHREAKVHQLANGSFQDTDFFPCWYCSLQYGKVDWLKTVDGHPWSQLVRAPNNEPAHASGK